MFLIDFFLTLKRGYLGELRVRNNENSCVPTVFSKSKNWINLMTSETSDTIAFVNISSVESFFSIDEICEQNVATKIKCNCVITNETAVLDVIDFYPSNEG